MFPKIATSRLFNNSKFIIFFQWHSRIIALVSVVFLFHLATLLRYPAPSCDESFYMRSSALYTQSIINGTQWPPSGATFFLPHGRIYWLILSTSLTILGKTLFAARLISLLGLIGLVVATYAVGHICVSKRVGMWSAVLTSFAWLTFYSGHLARPDVVSAATNTTLIALGFITIRSRQPWAFFILGCLVILQMDIHANSLHFVAPITLLATFHTLHHRSWKSLILFWSGILLGIVIYSSIHLSAFTLPMLYSLVARPTDSLGSYTGFQPHNLFATVFNSISYQWGYFLNFVPLASLPQAILFIIGLLYIPVSHNNQIAKLGFIILLSTITFGIINQGYQLVGYTLFWLPLYMVLGVAALDHLLGKAGLQFLRLSISSTLVFTCLAILYISGDIYLSRTSIYAIYQQEARELSKDIPPNSRVLASSYWWMEMNRLYTFIDEHGLTDFGSGLWWNGLTDVTAEQLGAIREKQSAVTLSQQFPFEKLIGILQPKYIIDDSVIGCFPDKSAVSQTLTDYAQEHCQLIQNFNSDFVRYYLFPPPAETVQTLYKCRLP